MTLTNNLIGDLLIAYRNGLSPSKICISFGLSERGYFDIIKKYPSFQKSKKIRIMNQKKKRDSFKTNLHGNQVEESKKVKSITPEEKISHLQQKLEHEQKKNKELEELLKLAKEKLGKF